MTLVNPATDNDRTGGMAHQPAEVVAFDLHLREIEAFAVLREMAGTESPAGRPTRALAVRCLAARVASQGMPDPGADDFRRALAFSEYVEWRIDGLTQIGDALGLL
jgi:hypothetical protein